MQGSFDRAGIKSKLESDLNRWLLITRFTSVGIQTFQIVLRQKKAGWGDWCRLGEELARVLGFVWKIRQLTKSFTPTPRYEPTRGSFDAYHPLARSSITHTHTHTHTHIHPWTLSEFYETSSYPKVPFSQYQCSWYRTSRVLLPPSRLISVIVHRPACSN